MNKKPTMLLIMDGYGIGKNEKNNAIFVNGSKNVYQLINNYPSTVLNASGMAVGLPDGQMGNSEVGHLNIGAGRIVYQELTRITKSILDGDFFSNEALLKACKNATQNNKALHIMGLLSDGGVHSHLDHVFAFAKLAKEQNVKEFYIHCFMDGRDVSPTSGESFLLKLQAYLTSINYGKIASVCGRYYAMDRDNRWDRVETAYKLLVLGEGVLSSNPAEEVARSYKEDNVTDEFIKPIAVTENNKIIGRIKEGDSVIFFNFRPDRAREISRCFIDPNFNEFAVKKLSLTYVCLTQYDIKFADLDNVFVAYAPQTLSNTLGEYLASLNKSQLRIAETEKYAHVTFFFNGGVEAPNKLEERVLVSSPKVSTYDLKPEMSAYEVTDAVLAEIEKDKFDVIILNFANCDMVGHTGIFSAALKAVETVDICVKKICDKMLAIGGEVLITADHGNADFMYNEDNSPFTAHTTNAVPFILVSDKAKGVKLRSDACLADIAPTMLELMGINVPVEMEGKSIIIK